MADQKITELPIKGTNAIYLSDYLLGIDAAEGYQATISDMGDKILNKRLNSINSIAISNGRAVITYEE